LTSCKKLPPVTTNKTVKLRLSNFMRDCYSGNEFSGTSTNHVNYSVRIEVEHYYNGRYNPAGVYLGNSPTGPDKSVFERDIDVPQDRGFRIIVIVDGFECSKCRGSWCNSYRRTEGGQIYVVEAGKPYWTAEVPYASNSIPASNILQITPYVSPRNPNGWPPENCNCKIKE
jgi:hypothetical protein